MTATAQSVVLNSSNLPVFVIDTYGQEIQDREKITAHLGIIFNGENQRNYMSDPFNEYDGWIGIELRGSSSTMFPKKQYAVETRDSLGENLNVPLLGMPEENDWVLYAPYSDKTLIRNVLAYGLARKMGWYASRTRFCELILNGDYQGVYVLMEKIKHDKNRVDISTLNPDEVSGDDLTGGYIIKVDKVAGENIDGWTSPFPPSPGSTYRIFYQYHYPKPDEIVPEQQKYIRDQVTSFEACMLGPDFADPVNGYPKYIRPESFIDVVIQTEFGKNVDGYRLSAFMYKDKESVDNRFVAGPIWDYNLAFGNANYYSGGSVSGWQIMINSLNDFRHDSYKVPFWWEKLFNEPAFAGALYSRWVSLRQNILSEESLMSWIDSVTTVLDESQARNFIRWPILDTYIWPNQVWLGTYENEINYLKTWIKARLTWIDDNLPGGSTGLEEKGKSVPPENEILEQNYPNPFNGTTVIPFHPGKKDHIQIIIRDISGKVIRILKPGAMSVGSNFVVWDGKDGADKYVSSGIYFYSLEAGPDRRTKRMLLLR
jgi:hypothetical protein